MLWEKASFQDRAVALWEAFARRYKEEPAVAGYNLVNEPEAADVSRLNGFYCRTAEAIRKIDPRHILFLEGNIYSQQLDPLDAPFDANLVYSTHYYFDPGLDAGEYPGTFRGQFYDRQRLKELYAERTAFARRHNVPHWYGEFGCIYGDPAFEASRLRVMADLIDIAEEFGDHWTIWNYKDIGRMGLFYANPSSEWMCVTEPVRRAKTALRCDYWIERQHGELDPLIDDLEQHVRNITAGMPGRWDTLNELLHAAIGSGLLSQMLLPAFADQFRGMDKRQIDMVMQSFALGQCVQRQVERAVEDASCEPGRDTMSEFTLKQDRIMALLAKHRLDALLLQRVSSFAWATCGVASYINTAATNGEAMLLITADGRWLITNNIEAPRLTLDPRIQTQGWNLNITPWHEATAAVANLTRGRALGGDGPYPGAVDLSADVARLRAGQPMRAGHARCGSRRAAGSDWLRGWGPPDPGSRTQGSSGDCQPDRAGQRNLRLPPSPAERQAT
jgi:hypothetical protein